MQAELRPDVQLSLDEFLSGYSLPRRAIGLQTRLSLFDRFAKAPPLLKLAFGGVFLAARRARRPLLLTGCIRSRLSLRSLDADATRE